MAEQRPAGSPPKTNRTGGKREGAGRKSLFEEKLSAELADLSTKECLKALRRQGEYKDLPTLTRLALAEKFALKAMPQKVEGAFTGKVTHMGTVKVDGKPMEFKIG